MSVIAVGRPGGWSQQSRASVLSNRADLCRIIAIYIIPVEAHQHLEDGVEHIDGDDHLQ